MEIHKPKPIRNWRDFLKEVGTIVLGVVIALAAEQAVEWWHWQHRTRDAMEAMRLELRDDDAPQAYTRAAAKRCFENQLDAIQAAIEAGRSRAEITALIDRYAPPRRTWNATAWESMLASGVAVHVAPDRMIELGQIYASMPLAQALTTREAEDLVALHPIRKNGDRLSTSEADTMLAALSRLRADNRSFAQGTAYLLEAIAQNGITLTPEQKNRILGDLRGLYHDCVVEPQVRTIDSADQLNIAHPAGAR